MEAFQTHSLHSLISLKFILLIKGLNFFIVVAKSAKTQNSIVIPIFPLDLHYRIGDMFYLGRNWFFYKIKLPFILQQFFFKKSLISTYVCMCIQKALKEYTTFTAVTSREACGMGNRSQWNVNGDFYCLCILYSLNYFHNKYIINNLKIKTNEVPWIGEWVSKLTKHHL